MGTIAARDCVRVIELSEQIAAAALLAGTQALRLRRRAGDSLPHFDGSPLETIYQWTLEFFTPLEDDRPLDADLRKTLELIRSAYF